MKRVNSFPNKSAELHKVRYLENQFNQGYGASLKKGILSAKGEIIVITDADGTYPAEEIPKLLHLLKNCDMVVGARIGKNVGFPSSEDQQNGCFSSMQDGWQEPTSKI